MAKKKAKTVKKVKETAVEKKVELLGTKEHIFRFDDYNELVEVLTSVQEAPDNAIVRYRVTKDAPSDQATAVVVDGVVCIHPNNVRGFITQAPSFHYEHVNE